MGGANLQRLDRLETYLRDDPENGALLADAFAEALRAGALERAEFHLRHAQALGLDALAWSQREAHWLLAQHRWDEASRCLHALLARNELGTERAVALTHDLAYADLRGGKPLAGIKRLAPLMNGAMAPRDAATEVLWLQLLHQAGRLEDAMAWLMDREGAGHLSPAAAGVGSLVALDSGDHASSLRWAERSLAEPSPRPEAQVARASLALAERKPTLARDLLQKARETNDSDGRVWSALGFAELLDGRLTAARAAFERATRLLAGHVGTWHGLGWTALAQNDRPAARDAFEHALELDRNFAETHGATAVLDALDGHAGAARAAIERALRLDRSCLSARYAEALLNGDARDSAASLRLAERLLAGRSAPLGGPLIDIVRNGGPAGRT